MQHIPVPVVERLAVFADDKSLVLFASCSQWLWQCVGIQQRVWRQRYIQHYTFKDDDEVQWLSWYVRTLRVSGALATTSNTAIDVTQLNDHDINWFRAFCHRRATSANWLRDRPYPIYDIVEDTSDSDQVIVLQRISNNSRILGECGIIEQCQPIGKPKHQQFWRLRKVCCDGFDPTVNVKQFLVSDKFVVAVFKKTDEDIDLYETPYNVLIWPIHRVSTIQPYSAPYLCNRKMSIRGRWLLFSYIKRSSVPKLPPLSTTRVFDMATRQICMGSIQNSNGTSFIQRATEDTVTVFYAYTDAIDTFQTVYWGVWQFSVCQLEDNPQCLTQGKFIITYLFDLRCPVERLDNDRVLVVKTVACGFNEAATELNSEVLSLAVISTNCDNSNQYMDNQKPIWSHYIEVISAIPIITSNAIAIIASKGLSIYSLSDGTMLSQINMEVLESIIPNFEWHISKLCKIQNLIVYTYMGGHPQIIDLIQPTNSKRLGIVDAELLAIASVKSNTTNALVMHSEDGYKIVDISY